MRSSETLRRAAVLALLVAVPAAQAQEAAVGFALERLAPAAGSPWLGLEALDTSGELSGAAGVTAGWAHNPLVVQGPGTRLAVVAGQAVADYALSASWSRLRLGLVLSQPLLGQGSSGTVDGVDHAAPALSLSSHPDVLSDTRLDATLRMLGTAEAPVRLGLGAQLYVPSGPVEQYLSDGTVRANLRLLAAGTAGPLEWAGHGGVHLRPRLEAWQPGGPLGSEASAGLGLALSRPLHAQLHGALGLEAWGQAALAGGLRTGTAGLEALLTGRLDAELEPRVLLRVKAGAGAGLVPGLGTPALRAVLAIELLGRVRP